jgi:hypothetical protein
MPIDTTTARSKRLSIESPRSNARAAQKAWREPGQGHRERRGDSGKSCAPRAGCREERRNAGWLVEHKQNTWARSDRLGRVRAKSPPYRCAAERALWLGPRSRRLSLANASLGDRLKQSTQLLIGSKKIAGCRARLGNDDEVHPGRQGGNPTIAFTQPPLDSIAHHCTANLLADRDAKTGAALAGWPRWLPCVEHEIPSCHAAAPLLHEQKARPLPESLAAAKPLAPAWVGHLSLFLGNADREPLAPLAAAALEHFAALGCTHALAEAVRALAALSVWLIRPLHWILRCSRYWAGRTNIPDRCCQRQGEGEIEFWEGGRSPGRVQVDRNLTGFRLSMVVFPSSLSRRMRALPSENRRKESRKRAFPDGNIDELGEEIATLRRKADTFLSRKRSKAHAMAISARLCRACLWIQGLSGFRLKDHRLFPGIIVTWTCVRIFIGAMPVQAHHGKVPYLRRFRGIVRKRIFRLAALLPRW